MQYIVSFIMAVLGVSALVLVFRLVDVTRQLNHLASKYKQLIEGYSLQNEDLRENHMWVSRIIWAYPSPKDQFGNPKSDWATTQSNWRRLVQAFRLPLPPPTN